MSTANNFSWREQLLASPAVAVAIFCGGLLSCTVVGAGVIAIAAHKANNGSLDVKGVSSQLIESDRVEWSFRVRGESANRTSGAKYHSSDVQKALQFLGDRGINKKDIVVKVLVVNQKTERNPENGRVTPTGWEFSQEIVVISDDVHNVAVVSQDSSQLIEMGIDAHFSKPEFTYSKIAEKRVELLKGATENAKERAQAIANTGNVRLGEMSYVGTAIFQVTTPGSSSLGGGGIYDTETINKKISAVMDIRFKFD